MCTSALLHGIYKCEVLFFAQGHFLVLILFSFAADSNSQTLWPSVFSSCFCKENNLLLPLHREKKKAYKREEQGRQAAEDGSLQIYHPAMEWKEVLLVWSAGFHFTLIQCEVFRTHECGLGR